ncbi:hypothetical protein M408DRAFT_199364 [Serendipita vermifera MAFF 305830]|uniref:Uncharacterized protein n=1 Tax=Serendipita vermifera MAFF 305830 TaxID=933852 RepID=A0A0C2WI56_SERVB|nr:hypothetical protein M408DRAFT_199364 [Serendipita vermifera MAFF 305830]
MPLRSPLRVRNPGESDFSDDQSDGDEPFYAQPGTNRFTPSPSTTGNNNLRDLSSSKHFPSPTSDHPRVIKVLATSDGGNKWTTVDLGDARSSQIVKERLFAELNIEPDYQRLYAIHQQQGDLAVGPPLSDKLIVNICQTYGSSTSSLRFAIQPSQVGMQSSPMPTPSSIGALPTSRTPTSANHIQSSSRIIPRLSIDTTRLGTSNQSNSPQGRKLPPIPSKAPSVPPLHTSPTPSPVEHQNQSGGITEPLKLSLNGQSRSGHSGESEYKLSRPSHPHDSVSHDATLEGTKVTRQTKYSNLPNPLAGPLPSTNWSPSPSPDSLVATVNDSSPTLEGKKQNGGPLSRSTRDIPSPALHLAHLQPPTRAARIGAYDEPRRSLPSKSQENLRHTYSRTNDMAPSPTASSPGIGTGGNRSMPNNGTNSNSGSRPSPVSRGPRSRFPPPPPTNADLPIISDLPTPSSSFPNHPHAPLSSSTAMRQAQLVVMEPSMGNGSRRFPATQSRQPSPRYDNPLDIDDRQTENLFDDRLAGSPFSRTSPASPQATTPSGIMSPSQCDKRQPPSPANSQGSTPARPLPKPSPMISASTSVPASPSNLNIPPLGRPPPLPVHQAFISNEEGETAAAVWAVWRHERIISSS